MNETEIVAKLTEVDSRSKSNCHRIDKLEKDNEALTEMAGSIKLLAYQQSEANTKIDKIDGKVTALEKAPGETWKKILGYIAAALCSAGVGALITYIFSR